MDEPKTLHIWIHDGRTLCDRRARLPSSVAEMTDEEFEDHIREQTTAPACGSCLLVAGNMRYQAAVLLKYADGAVHPVEPREGWGQLRDTRWARRFDIDELLGKPEVEDVRYERINYEIDPARVDEGVGEWSTYEADLRAYREQALAEAPES